MRGQDTEWTRALYELRSMIGHVFRTPPLPVSISLLSTRPPAFGLLFIGISMALMLFGVVTFFIGFVLMPLVFMLVLLFYFVRIVSKVFEIGRDLLCPANANNQQPTTFFHEYDYKTAD